MWQCKHCHERFIEHDPNHVCVDDTLSGYFKGRKALLEPLFNELLRQLQKKGPIQVVSQGSFMALKNKEKIFATIRIGVDRLEIFIGLPIKTPVPADFHQASQLKIAGMTHYCSLSSVSDLNNQMLNAIIIAKSTD